MKWHAGMAVVIAATFASMAGAASHDEGPDSLAVRSITLRYDSARIRDRKSAERLFFRIRRAAEEVCRIASYPRGYEIWDEHACEVDTVAHAVKDANLPALDRYYYKGPHPLRV